MKVLQLGAGVGVFLPVMTVFESGGALTLGQAGLLTGVVVGTAAAGSSLSWYCQRLVCELSWRPAERALRVSTLSVWGHRDDRDLLLPELPELLAPSFVPTPEAPTPLDERQRAIPLRLGDERSYLLLLHRPSLRRPSAVFALLEGRVPAEWLHGVAMPWRYDGYDGRDRTGGPRGHRRPRSNRPRRSAEERAAIAARTEEEIAAIRAERAAKRERERLQARRGPKAER